MAASTKIETTGTVTLIIYNVTGTCDPKGEPLTEQLDLEMKTGSSYKEDYCNYDANWTEITTVQEGMKPPTKSIKSGNGVVRFAFNLQNIHFTKEMYKPNEIIAEIQIAPGSEDKGTDSSGMTFTAEISKADLESSFINKQVTLKCDNTEVCDDYYIHEIVPQYKQDAMYVTFKMYSPDKMLTLHNYCRSFVSKKLCSEILSEEIKNYKLPYKKDSTVSIDYNNLKMLKKGTQEHIFPYLVQYNESFYSFLKRTTNRWAEFLYYEDGNLCVGYKGDAVDKSILDTASNTTYSDLTNNLPTQENIGSYNAEAPIDKQILNNPLTKGEYDIVKGEIDSLGSFKEKDGDVYLMKKAAAFLNNDKTIYTFLVDEIVDDGIASYQADKVSKGLNTDFDNMYFNNKSNSEIKFNDEQFSGKTKLNPFSEFSPILDSDVYQKVIKQELVSGQNSIIVEFETTYPNIKLGQIITKNDKNYLVVKVEGYQPKILKIMNDNEIVFCTDPKKVNFKITAIPEVTDSGTQTKYFPSIIPEGHVRYSGTQMAKVSDVNDPLRQNRVRVKFNWQGSKEWSTPWLLFASSSGTENAGIYAQHYKGDQVVVNFLNGNVERPYVVGTVDTTMPFALRTNNIVHRTPAGQAIKMSDGFGAGLDALLASFNPGFKMIKGLDPAKTSFGGFSGNKSMEGSIELCDKYGFWSIKGCTDNRNITIKSPWGDVKINAFTGITISAPNGDVKIRGKNVSIEAGNNLTLSSGKNISQKWWMDGESCNAVTIAKTATNVLTDKIASLLVNVTDLSLLRHIVEVIFRPVEGKIQISAGRFMMLEAGGKKAGYPVEAYRKSMQDVAQNEDRSNRFDDMKCAYSFERITKVVNKCYADQANLYTVARLKRLGLDNLINDYKNKDGELQCNTVDSIINDLWANPDKDPKTVIGFKGVFEDVTADQNPKLNIIAHFKKVATATIAGITSDKLLKNMWTQTVGLQTTKKNALIEAVKQLAGAIKKVKNLEVKSGMNNNFQVLNNTLTTNNLPDFSLLKKIKTDDTYKKFTVDYPDIAAEKKKVCRKFFIDLVKGFQIPRSATECNGITKPTVFAEPQPDCSDEDWAKYCRSIQTIRKKKEEEGSVWSKIGEGIGDALANNFSGIGDVKNILTDLDSICFGSSKKGEILFSTEDGTMVLDRGIYRANVGGVEGLEPDPQHPREPNGSAYVGRVRKAMLSV